MSLEERRDFLARCTRCSQCKFVPTPQSQRFASACPSIDYGNFHSYSGGGKLITGYALLEQRVEFSDELKRSVYACTLCGACDTSCKVNFGETVEPLDSLYAIRAQLAKDGHSPTAHRALLDNLQAHGNAQGLSASARARWATGLTLSNGFQDTCEVLLHIGSDAACDESLWPGMRRVVADILAAPHRVAWLGEQEGSSGSLAFDLGFTDVARRLAENMADKIRRTGARQLLTFSAAAYAAFRNIYPRLGVDLGTVEVLHVSTWLARQKPVKRSFAGVVTYHDPCKLGRLSEPYQPHDQRLDLVMNAIYTSRAPHALRFGNGGEYAAPRALLSSIDQLQLVEMERNRASSYCCGASAGAKQGHPDFAELAASNRLEEAIATGAEVLVTSCAGCSAHLGAVARSRQLPIRVMDLLSLLDESTSPSARAAELS